MNVGVRSVARASEVQEKGAPELVAAVDQGRVSVSAAANIAALSKEEQREIVARGKRKKAPPDKPAGLCNQIVQGLVIRGGGTMTNNQILYASITVRH
jgi:hypothetical protein